MRSLVMLFARHEGHMHQDTMADTASLSDGDDPSLVTDDMNVGTVDVLWMPQVYWIFVGSVIALFAMVHLSERILCWQRLSAARKQKHAPARPKHFAWRLHATVTAVCREASNASLPPLRLGRWAVIQPSFGAFFLVAANLTLVIVLCFYRLNPSQYFESQNTAYRCGFVSMGQLPLVFLLAGKNNLIGFFTGISYERLNWIHRWVSRTLLITITLHLAFWFKNWAPYDYISTMIYNDPVTQKGLAAWVILLWIFVSSFAPIRAWSYEFFVIQHAASYIAFITMIFLHTPTSDHGWLWAVVAIFFFDRVSRTLITFYTNLSIFHSKQRKAGTMSRLWACKATMTPLEGGMTRITIPNPPLRWRPGQHALVSCHSIVPLQSHPFTIASIPSDEHIEFLVRSHRGGTRRIHQWAQKQFRLPSSQETTLPETTSVSLEGPYGKTRDLGQFDSIVLLAGSSGASFTVPLLRDLVNRWKIQSKTDGHTIATRRVRFVWVVKSRQQISWFSEQLGDICQELKHLKDGAMDVKVDLSVYVTCDPEFTDEWTGSAVQHTDNRNQDEKSGTFRDGKITTGEARIQKLGSRTDSDSMSSDAYGSSDEEVKTCQPDGTCCCQTIIKDEAEAEAQGAAAVTCSCDCSHSSETASPQKAARPVHPAVGVFSGRPHPKSIIRRVLEEAYGESAVMVCGPRGLNEDTRRSVVALSDERAVHKGTGAQGIWFHGEGFGY